ncbi:hypothetical protein QVD17_05501 [Tagetes erecta]|uniref:Uncharacterized protein n=1 Tax=Tagetes erecta TaxID=13708 RepID=A0AAD8PBJ0_TARER|nr:hypothetical protein QVD17_05501 [Tagetes erecta]
MEFDYRASFDPNQSRVVYKWCGGRSHLLHVFGLCGRLRTDYSLPENLSGHLLRPKSLIKNYSPSRNTKIESDLIIIIHISSSRSLSKACSDNAAGVVSSTTSGESRFERRFSTISSR